MWTTWTTELRFEASGWRTYAGILKVIGVGLIFVLLGGFCIAWNLPSGGNISLVVVGAIDAFLGLLVIGLALFLVGATTILACVKWRQLRLPAVLVDASGVHYLAPRRPLSIPWSDIEQVGLHRTVYRSRSRSRSYNRRVDTGLFVRLRPDSTALDDSPLPLPADRVLRLGDLSKLPVPEDFAVRFLEKTTGSPVEVTVTDRRLRP
jgi:hypothetical protein